MDQKKSVPLDKLLQAVRARQHRARRALHRRRAPRAPGERPARRRAQARIAQAAGGLDAEGPGARHRRRARTRRRPPPAGGRGRAAQAAIKPLSNPTLRELIAHPQAAERTGHRHRHAGPRARSRLLRGRARARAQGIVQHLRALHRAAQGRDHRAADPLQPPDQGAAEVRRPEGTGRHAARPAAPDGANPRSGRPTPRWTRAKVKGASTPAHPHRPRLAGALRDAPGERAGAVPRARGRQLQGVDGAAAGARARRSPTSSAGGWRRWPSTSPPTSASRPRTSSYAPFNQRGGLGKVHQLFGAELPKVIEALNRELAA